MPLRDIWDLFKLGQFDPIKHGPIKRYLLYAVKPVYSGRPWDLKKAAVWQRCLIKLRFRLVVDDSNWPLFTGGCCSQVIVKSGLTVHTFGSRETNCIIQLENNIWFYYSGRGFMRSRIMGPIPYGIKIIQIDKYQITLSYVIFYWSKLDYYDQSVIGISLSLSQSDHIKRLLLQSRMCIWLSVHIQDLLASPTSEIDFFL
jgi:hypothetical protein